MPKEADKPWERQKGESDKAYQAFSTYLDMGPERTLRAVGEKLGKSTTLIERWSCNWKWRERIRAYDNSLEKEARKKAVADRKAMMGRHIGIAMQLQKKALEALEVLEVENMSPKDVKEYLKMATELERLNRTLEEAEERSKSGGKAQLADAIISAYQSRKEDGNA